MRRARQVRQPGAEQAVAALQPMIEKARWSGGGDGGEPQRQPRELYGHGIHVDAVETALCDEPSHRRAIGFVDLARKAAPFAYQRRLVRAGEKSTGGHQERAAAHRRVDDAQPEDAIGQRVARERRERAPHEIFGNRLRRVEGAGGLAHARPRLERDRMSAATASRRRHPLHARLVVEQRFVHRTELLDTKIAIRDPPAARSGDRGSGRQREYRVRRSGVIQIPPLGQGRSEEHTSELQSLAYLVCRLLLEKKKKKPIKYTLIRL